ncbi:MAG TPA: ABC transporter substrate-binding protein [Streptosporangiaceae bacterium]|nr:ABC transporter substrate-binding protein [Streptosporangiaceae bacterium]
MRAITRQLPALVAVAAIAAASAACGSSTAGNSTAGTTSAQADSAGFPVTVTTAGGKTHLTARPDAIVSLSPTATEMLYAIGAGKQVEAVDSDSDYPRTAPITKLSGFEPNAEAIAAYKPDLVIISNNIDGITAKLTALSIPVLDLPAAADLSDVYSEFTELGAATGHVTQAKSEDSKLAAEVASVLASEPKHTKPLTYYYELSANPYYSVTDSTFVGSVLSLLGMKSIADAATGAAAAGGYPELSPEFILKANPDYILLADTGSANGGQDAATVGSRPGWSVLTAVKEKHIIVLNADIASRWGPRIIDLLKTVAAGIKSGSQ